MADPHGLMIAALDDFTFDMSALASKLRITDDSEQLEELHDLAAQAAPLARPRYAYKLVYIDSRGDDYVVLDGIRFTSRILRKNVLETDRAFAAVASCGPELELWSETLHDPLYQYWSEALRIQALAAASARLVEAIDTLFKPGHIAGMNPGSLTDWPISEQRPFFKLLGDTEAAIGVKLQPSLLMWPTKSASTLFFPTSSDFQSCQLCPRERCPNRRAPYQANKMSEYFA
ncbi:MAG: vitamin B12 dependent methionine synthase [Chloroflexi bacterium]|nr:vitamin B12 dependent methionine synthase [Chloroflexota bacterium]